VNFGPVFTNESPTAGILVCGYLRSNIRDQNTIRNIPFVVGVDAAGEIYLGEVGTDSQSELSVKQFCQQNNLLT
jgi:hypothetical protein